MSRVDTRTSDDLTAEASSAEELVREKFLGKHCRCGARLQLLNDYAARVCGGCLKFFTLDGHEIRQPAGVRESAGGDQPDP